MVDIVIDGFVLENNDERVGRSQFYVGVKNNGTIHEELTGFKLSDGTVESRDRLEREARILKLLDGGAFPRLLSQGELPDGRHYLQMEFLTGENLRELVEHTIPPALALYVVAEIARGVGDLHRLGWIHRDLKPENIMFAEGRIRIVDLGSAVERSATAITRQGLISGTPAYMAPEQIEGMQLGPKVDCWALGVILYELCCGERPFSRPTEQEEVAAILGAPTPVLGDRDSRTRFVILKSGEFTDCVSNMATWLLERNIGRRAEVQEVLDCADELAVPTVSLAEWFEHAGSRRAYNEDYAAIVMEHARGIVAHYPREAIAAANAALRYTPSAVVSTIMAAAAAAAKLKARDSESNDSKPIQARTLAFAILVGLIFAVSQWTKPRLNIEQARSTIAEPSFPSVGLRDARLPARSPVGRSNAGSSPRAQLALGYRLIGDGQLLSAHRLLVQLQARAPSAAGLVALAHLYERAGNTERASAILDDALRVHPRDTELLYLRATLASGSEQERGLRAALAINGRHAGALQWLCSSLANDANVRSDATRVCNRAVQVLPQNAYVLADRAEAKRRSGDVVGARHDLERARRLAPAEQRFSPRLDALRALRSDGGSR